MYNTNKHVMKNLILIYFITFSSIAFGQKLSVNPNGLRDEANTNNPYVVIEAEGKSAKQLYDNALNHINKSYKNPENVIKVKTEGEYIRFNTHVSSFIFVNNAGVKIPINVNYTIELSFKDGKAKLEVVDLDMYSETGGYKVLFTGGAFDGYPIYNKKGELKRPDTKSDIETYFNSQIDSIKASLLGISAKDDW